MTPDAKRNVEMEFYGKAMALASAATLVAVAQPVAAKIIEPWTSQLTYNGRGPERTVRVAEVADGDTVTVEYKGGFHKVRLANIDAPEKAQPFGKESTRFLQKKVLGKFVKLQPDGMDKYGRIIGTIHIDGENVNLGMACDGFAWAYTQYLKDARIADCQASAKQHKRGLWAHGTPMAPWNWRHRPTVSATPYAAPKKSYDAPTVYTAPKRQAKKASVYYANCSAARAAGAAPLTRGSAGYRSRMDRDGDGVACE
jgi:endonuclease YncB( thermonuclease family)